MKLNKKIGFFSAGLTLMVIIFGFMAGCGSDYGTGTPKDCVIHLFGAMERDDQAAILALLDIRHIMEKGIDDYALQTDEPRIFHNPKDMLDDLTGEGKTKTRWFSMQTVIGLTDVQGDSATVEVSFINKTTQVQYYTKFGLYKKENRWKIYSFKKIDDE